MEEEEKIVEMFVAGLVLDPSSNAPIVILKDASGGVCLPIWIGLAEATAIASALKKVQLARPMTHDLLKTVIDQFGGRVVRIVVTALRESTFLASAELVVGESLHVVDCRPSDAIALAVRVECPIFVAAQVLAQAQVSLVAVGPNQIGGEEGTVRTEAEDGGDSPDFATIDKEKWAQILASMDPDDFKYKM